MSGNRELLYLRWNERKLAAGCGWCRKSCSRLDGRFLLNFIFVFPPIFYLTSDHFFIFTASLFWNNCELANARIITSWRWFLQNFQLIAINTNKKASNLKQQQMSNVYRGYHFRSSGSLFIIAGEPTSSGQHVGLRAFPFHCLAQQPAVPLTQNARGCQPSLSGMQSHLADWIWLNIIVTSKINKKRKTIKKRLSLLSNC